MFTKSSGSASLLDKAVAASVAAMLAMNLFVLTQQHSAVAIAAAPAAPAAAQA